MRDRSINSTSDGKPGFARSYRKVVIFEIGEEILVEQSNLLSRLAANEHAATRSVIADLQQSFCRRRGTPGCELAQGISYKSAGKFDFLRILRPSNQGTYDAEVRHDIKALEHWP